MTHAQYLDEPTAVVDRMLKMAEVDVEHQRAQIEADTRKANRRR